MRVPLRLLVVLVAGCGARSGLAVPEGAVAEGGVPDAIAEADAVDAAPDVVWPPLAVAAAQLAVGPAHACFVRDGVPHCWGNNLHGAIGDGTNVDRAVPTRVASITRVSKLIAQLTSTCALLSDRTVWCWGDYFARSGFAPPPGPAFSTPQLVLSNQEDLFASSDAMYTCASDSGTTHHKCWGQIQELCGDSSGDSLLVPVDCPKLDGVDNLALASDHLFGHFRGASWRGLGGNVYGALGDGTTARRMAFVDPIGLSRPAIQLSTAAATCAVLSDRSAMCWGYNNQGQVGDGTTTSRHAPVVVPGLRDVASIHTNLYTTCARMLDRTVRCWGDNRVGLVGDGTTVRRLTPTPVVGLDDVVELGLNQLVACARRSDDSIWCWGDNGYGQLGTGKATPGAPSLRPVRVAFP